MTLRVSKDHKMMHLLSDIVKLNHRYKLIEEEIQMKVKRVWTELVNKYNKLIQSNHLL